MTDTSAASKAAAQSALPIVYVVDDDESIRESLVDLFRSIQMDAVSFATTTAFLDTADLRRPGCILLDVRLPGLSGLDFQLHLERIGSRMPIVFMTGFGDIPMSVRAMKAGAVDFSPSPSVTRIFSMPSASRSKRTWRAGGKWRQAMLLPYWSIR